MSIIFPKNQHLAALIFTIGLFTIFVWVGVFAYETNDDMAITALVKGLYGRAASAEGIFISPLLGWALYTLYKIFPLAPWFSLFLYGGLLLACYMGSLIILTSINSHIVNIAGLIGTAFFIYLTALSINFAAVAMLLWLTGCMCLAHLLLSNRLLSVWFWLASFQMAVAYLLRPSLLPLLAVLSVPLFSTFLLLRKRTGFLLAVAPLLVTIILSTLVASATRSGPDYSQYGEFNKLRSSFLDTAKSWPTINTKQARLAAKWSEEDLAVISNWWIHDDTLFNTEKIEIFLSINSNKFDIFQFSMFKRNFVAYEAYFGIIVFWLFVIFSSGKSIFREKYLPGLIAGYLFLLLAGIYLMGVRFPARIAQPYFFMLFLYSTLIFENLKESKRFSIQRFTPAVAFIIFLIFTCSPILQSRFGHINFLKNSKEVTDQSVVNVLKINGPDSIIIDVRPGQLPINYFPFHENDAALKIRIMPGGWLVGSPVYLDFLKREGLGDRSTVVSSLIDNPRAVFRYQTPPSIWWVAPYLESHFLVHLRQRYSKPGSKIEIKPLEGFSLEEDGLIYFHLITTPI